MTSFSQEVAEVGLFHYTALMMKQKRAALKPVQRWVLPTPTRTTRGKGKLVLPKVTPVEEIVKPLQNLASADNIDDDVIEQSPDDAVELNLAEPQAQAGEEVEEPEEGTVSDDVVTVDE